jgi:hypothetical protein
LLGRAIDYLYRDWFPKCRFLQGKKSKMQTHAILVGGAKLDCRWVLLLTNDPSMFCNASTKFVVIICEIILT